MFDPFSALMQGFIGLDKLHSENGWIDFGLSLIVNWFCVFTFSWGSVGLASFKAGIPMLASLGIGFLSALMSSSVILFIRLQTDPKTKKWTLLVGTDIAIAEQQQKEAGLEVIQGHK